MIHARKDYNRIQDPAVDNPKLLSPGSTAIDEDEPVFLLRAQDRVAPYVVRLWADLALAFGAKTNIIDAAQEQADLMDEWQARHDSKTPDMP